MTVLTTAKDFYDFFDSIPFYKWTTGTFQNRLGQRCAVGHIRAKFGSSHWNPTQDNLEKIVRKLTGTADPGTKFYNSGDPAMAINDFGFMTFWGQNSLGWQWRRTQTWNNFSPKGRMLAMLRDAMKAGL